MRGLDNNNNETKTMFIPTKYHEAIKSFILETPNHLIIEAGPGSGKTATVKNVIIPTLLTILATGGCLAFNTKNAGELKEAIKNPFVECSTVHSALLKCLKKTVPSLRVEVEKEAGKDFRGVYRKATVGKCQALADAMFPDASASERASACRLVSLAKNNAIGLPGYPAISDRAAWQEISERHSINNNNESSDYDIIEMGIEILKESVANKWAADHDDMIYMVLYLTGFLPNWDFLVYDEGQDATPLQAEFLSRMAKRGCRVIVVGDGHQSINMFAGAMQESLTVVAEMIGAKKLPLPVSYRCSKAAAILANQVFPGSVIPGPNAKEGTTTTMDWIEFISGMEGADIETGVLSRVHRFLLPLALDMIRNGREFRYKGIIDTVTKMERMLYHNAKASGNLSDIRRSLTEYQNNLEDKYLASGKPTPKWVVQAGEITDCLCILLVAVEKNGGDMQQVKHYLTKLSEAEKCFRGPTLSSIHAAKGLEWPNVYIIGAMRSTLATTESELYAEQCAEFVAVTRSSENIILVNSPE